MERYEWKVEVYRDVHPRYEFDGHTFVHRVWGPRVYHSAASAHRAVAALKRQGWGEAVVIETRRYLWTGLWWTNRDGREQEVFVAYP